MQPVSPEEFEQLVADALDSLPPQMAAAFSNVVVIVEDEASSDPSLLGLYEGIPQTERDQYSGALPDRISLYRIPLSLMAEDLEDLMHEIHVTLVHEFGHHMGLSEDRLHASGWG